MGGVHLGQCIRQEERLLSAEGVTRGGKMSRFLVIAFIFPEKWLSAESRLFEL